MRHPDSRDESPADLTSDYEPSPSDIRLLGALASEPTMAAVAHRMGCSDRHLRRLIGRLIERLGVPHVRAAIALAAQSGWIAVDNGTTTPAE